VWSGLLGWSLAGNVGDFRRGGVCQESGCGPGRVVYGVVCRGQILGGLVASYCA